MRIKQFLEKKSVFFSRAPNIIVCRLSSRCELNCCWGHFFNVSMDVLQNVNEEVALMFNFSHIRMSSQNSVDKSVLESN